MGLFCFGSVLVLFLASASARTEADILCDISAKWGCDEPCESGNDVCGATYNAQGRISQLNLEKAYLTALPEAVSELKMLTYLNVATNLFTVLPDSVLTLTKMKRLVLGPGFIKALPEGIGNLTNLVYLDVKGLGINKLPESMSSLHSLTHLDADQTKLHRFPSVLRQLRNLSYLSMSGCNISVLEEDDLVHLTKLKALFLTENSLTSLPSSIGSLHRLSFLTLIRNSLTALPDVFGGLANLSVLGVIGNQLTDLPASFGMLSRLQVLRLDGNYLNCDALALKGSNPSSILNACRGTQKNCSTLMKQDCESMLVCKWDVPSKSCALGTNCARYGPLAQCQLCKPGFGTDKTTGQCSDCSLMGNYWGNGTGPCIPCTGSCSKCDPTAGKCSACKLRIRPRKNGQCSSAAFAFAVLGICAVPVVAIVAGGLLFVRWRRRNPQGAEPLRVMLVTGDNDPRLVLEGLQHFDPTDRRLGLVVSPSTLSFGSTRAQLAVGDKSFDILTLAICGAAKSVKFRILLPDDVSERFTIEAYPREGTISAKKGNATVEISLTLHCTTRLESSLYVIVDEKRFTELRISAESMLSTKLDVTELELGAILGSGAFGSDNESVLVDSVLRNDIEREVTMCTALRHNNVVSFFGSAQSAGKFLIVMELVEFGSLGSAVKNGPLPLPFKVRVALDIANGMDFLHRSHIIHRDLKTDNVLVASFDPTATVCGKLSDFNTSRFMGSDANRTKTKGIGTPVYMAPEILNGAKYDYSADVYSFGMVLWNMWTQREPYAEFVDQFAIYHFVNDGKRLAIPEDLPGPLQAITSAAWHPDPAQRPTFRQIATGLSSFAAH